MVEKTSCAWHVGPLELDQGGQVTTDQGYLGDEVDQSDQGDKDYKGVLGCTGLYCAVLGCTVRYCAVLGCDGLLWAVMDCTMLYWAVLCFHGGIGRWWAVLGSTGLYCAVLYWAVLDCTGRVISSTSAVHLCRLCMARFSSKPTPTHCRLIL